MNTCKALLLIAAMTLLALSAACSSTGSGTIKKDIYGNVTGQWQMVVDDNGYVTYVWVSTKPGVPLEAGPMVNSDGCWTGPLEGSVLLMVGSEPVEFDILPDGDGVLLMAPGLPSLPLPLAKPAL